MNKNSNISLFCSKAVCASCQGLFIACRQCLGLGFPQPRWRPARDACGAWVRPPRHGLVEPVLSGWRLSVLQCCAPSTLRGGYARAGVLAWEPPSADLLLHVWQLSLPARPPLPADGHRHRRPHYRGPGADNHAPNDSTVGEAAPARFLWYFWPSFVVVPEETR